MSKLVIGLGSGRSGSQSLAELLNSQKGALFTHEIWPIPWENGLEELDRVIGYLRKATESERYDLVGDSASYYLPYTERLLRVFPAAKFICLKRDRSQTIQSFLAKSGLHHHWLAHTGQDWRIDLIWDHTFPKYQIPFKEAAIGRYWDEYYQEASRLAEKFPGNFALFDLKELNHEAGQRAILTFLDIYEPVIITGIKANQLLSSKGNTE